MGASVTLADIALFPFVRRFRVGGGALCGFDVNNACDGAVGTWLTACEHRPSFLSPQQMMTFY